MLRDHLEQRTSVEFVFKVSYLRYIEQRKIVMVQSFPLDHFVKKLGVCGHTIFCTSVLCHYCADS